MTETSSRPDTLRVTEVFHSIQGEGTRAGRPTSFVRLTGCGLRCVWCDTAYAFQGGEDRTVADLVGEVVRDGQPLVCVTGGEPLEQPAALTLIARLCDAGRDVVIETGGHVEVAEVDRRASLIVDVKCPGSRMEKQNRWESLARLGARDEVKLVIVDRADYDYARRVVDEHRLAGRVGAILMSPVVACGECPGLDPAELAGWMVEDRFPGRLQLQLHKLIWPGVERGV